VPRRRLAVVTLAAALAAPLTLGACSSESPGGDSLQGPNTGVEQNAPNAGRPGLNAPDAGSGQQGDAPQSGGAGGSGG